MFNAENAHKWIAFLVLLLVGLAVISVELGILMMLWFLLCEQWDMNDTPEDDG